MPVHRRFPSSAILALILSVPVPLQATAPFYSESFDWQSITCDPSTVIKDQYYLNGSLNYTNTTCPGGGPGTSQGVGATTADGGSWISYSSSPTAGQHDVTAKLSLSAAQGVYVLYLNASNSAWYKSSGTSTGQGYAVTFDMNTSYSPGVYSGYFAVIQISPSYNQWLAGGSVSMTSSSTVRAVRTNVGGTWKILVYVDDVLIKSVSSGGYTTGKPGLGAYNAHAANFIDTVSYAPIEHGAPDNAALSAGLSHVTAPTYASFQWNPIGDSDGGSGYGASGVARYEIYRDGAFRGAVKHVNAAMAYLDTGLTPSTSYNYIVRAVDFHGNSTEVARAVTTSPGTVSLESTLPRRIGLPASAANWGSGGESLDLLSGNLHFSYPILSATGRGGYAAPLILSYNSQNWVEQSGVVSHFGKSLGAGYGWRLQFGAVRAVMSGYNVLYYVYEDPTGAEYPLDVLSGTLWRPSQFAPVLEFDAVDNRLWFKDGSFWRMESLSASGEEDAGTRYPTLMQDANGSQIYVRYRVGRNASWPNSSSRIEQIEDVLALTGGSSRFTYIFNYLGDGALTEKLYQISRRSNHSTIDRLTFAFAASPVTLASPIGGTSIAKTVRLLAGVERSGAGTTSFAYNANNSGEISRVTLPYGGFFDYSYANAAYAGISVREVTTRTLTPTPGAPAQAYSFTRTAGGSIPSATRVVDASNLSDKVWTFDTSPASISYGYWTQLDERALPSLAVKRRQTATYFAHAPAKVFLYEIYTTVDPGTSSEYISKSAQWLDPEGNLRDAHAYLAGDFVNKARTVRYSYLHYTDPGASHNRAVNRVTKVELIAGASTLTLQQQTWTNALAAGQTCSPALLNHAGCSATLNRFNLGSASAGGLTTNFEYDYAGNAIRTWGASPEVTGNFGAATNFSMPEVITPNNTGYLATAIGYDGDLRPKQSTAPNNAISLTNYDTYGRVAETISAAGTRTAYSYGIATGSRTDTVKAFPLSDSSAFVFASTVYDGLGRPIRAESGGRDWAVKSITETEYEPCACSPTGKVKRVSLPYAPGGAPLWTTYTYDALGRTLSVALPNGSGVTAYEYVKNTVKITDPAGKWKKYETDGLGQLVKVTEPNPAGGAELETLYSYNIRGQMSAASMTRGGTTQVRTFNYDLATGRLTSLTKPETGTTVYTYNTDGTVQHTVDAKLQKTAFTYDALKRVTTVKRFITAGGAFVEQPCQEVAYHYDANPESGATYNLRGRLALVVAKQCDSVVTAYSENYQYETSGLLLYRNSVWKRYNYDGYTVSKRVDPDWNELGAMTAFGYGTSGSLYSYGYTYDEAWRPKTMTGESLTLVEGVTYNAAGAMTAFTRNDGSGTPIVNGYTFNHLNQLTNQTVTKGAATLQNLTYTFHATQNNGQILSQTDALSAETVLYQYDALQRLVSAETASSAWGLAWSYDGFGNRTNQSVTKGSAPMHSVAIDAATNRIATAGHQYDANGNLTQMPLMTMGYDIANRMVTSNHSATGTESYGYNHASQRVFVRNGNTVTYYLYGLGGERLMEFQETCTGGACNSYQEKQRWIYFAGRKMFSKTGATLKAVTPTRLASEAKHFPYGETEGAPPSDTKDYFATYRRDGTGLDYAWNRYYSPAMGRFTTADPYGGSVNSMNPGSWNRYGYAGNDPVGRVDPTGLADFSVTVYGFAPTDPIATYWWTGILGSINCQDSPIGTPSPWGWLCSGSTFIYSEEIMSVLGPYYLQQSPNNWAGGGSSAPSSVLKSSDAAQALKDAFEKWKNCAKVLFNSGRRGSLDQKVSSITFIDGRGEGNMGMAGATDNTTFSQYHAQYPSVVATTLLTRGRGGLTISTTVVLWPDFFGAVDRGFPRPRVEQDATLVHEFIHVEWGLRLPSHKDFFSKFGISPKDNETDADAIARWIKDDCKQK